MAQTTVTQFATPGFIGYLAEQRASDVLKAGPLLKDEVIEFGRAIVLDADQNFAVCLPSAGTTVLAGVTYNAFTKQTALDNAATLPTFVKGDSVTYCARGAIWVAPDADVAIGDLVYVMADGKLTSASGETAAVFVLTFGGAAPDAEAVTVNGNVVMDNIGDLDVFAGLIAAQAGVASAVYDSGAHTITVTGTDYSLALTNESVAGAGATVALTNPTPGVQATGHLVSNARWLTNALADTACKLEINLP